MKNFIMNFRTFFPVFTTMFIISAGGMISAQDINDEMIPSSIIELPSFQDHSDQDIEKIAGDASIEDPDGLGAGAEPGKDLANETTPESIIEEPDNLISDDQGIEHVANEADRDPNAQKNYDDALENSEENIEGVPPEIRNQLEDPTRNAGDLPTAEEMDTPDEAIEDVAENVEKEPLQITDSDVEDADDDLVSDIEKDRRDALERAIVERNYHTQLANSLYLSGRDAFIRGNFENAVEDYQRAIDEVNKTVKTENPPADAAKLIRDYRQAINQAYCSWADQLIHEAEAFLAKADPAKAAKAKDCLEKAQKIWPESAPRVAPKIVECEKLEKSLIFSTATSIDESAPDQKDWNYQNSVQMRRGWAFYRNKNYESAREMFENVLRRDPYNREAADAMRKVNEATYDAALRRLASLRIERGAEVETGYVNTLPPRVPTGDAPIEDGPVLSRKVSKIDEKLQNIVIDHIAFEDIPLSDALRHLSARSRELDPKKEGVNFFLRVQIPNAEGEEGEEVASATGNPDEFFRVSLIIDAVPLSQVIDLVCKAATRNNVEVKKNVEDYAVVIYSSNVAIGALETRIWPIENPPSEMPENDAKGLIDYFINLGVSFPEGSRAIYDKDISRLIVTNTFENITRIDQIIEDFKGAEPQVLIEARFVEIAQNDLKELGFDWMITRDPPNSSSSSIPFRFGTASKSIPASTGTDQWVSDPSSPTGYRLVQVTQPTPNALRSIGNNGIGNSTIEPGQIKDKAFWWRHTADRQTGNPINPNVSDNWGSQMGTDVDFAVRALSQCQTADLLATPRVTTMNGEMAMIRMVTEVYYPTEWTEPQTFSMNNNNFNFNNDNNNTDVGNNNVPMGVIGSTPIFGDPEQIGIRLEVTPYVSQDNKSISLEMNPQILDFAGWNEYSYELDVNADGQIDAAEKQILRMPIIETRQVTTTVRVDDGETLILGGALRDKTYTIRDKIPLIGDIPIVGRFFRTDGSLAKKTNLLIFVNCRLVHPDGQPIRGQLQRGVPSFRR